MRNYGKRQNNSRVLEAATLQIGAIFLLVLHDFDEAVPALGMSHIVGMAE
jgi:hypothetical protein